MDIKCPSCKGTNVVRRGFSPTKLRGKQQRYLCHDCGKTFIPDQGFWKMKNNEAKITKAIDLYFSNLSSRKVRNMYRRHEETKISHVGVLDWCRKYVLKVQKYVDTLAPRIGGRCYADDTQIDCEGRKDHFWACVDWDTRYINAIHYSVGSAQTEAVTFLRKAGRHTPKYIQTDAAMFYPAAFKKAFYSNKLQGLRVEHRVQNTALTGKFNVRIETVFMKIKDRVDDFRGLKAVWSAPILLAGLVLQHNFVEAHTTTGKIPAELAGLPTDGINRWLELINLASMQLVICLDNN